MDNSENQPIPPAGESLAKESAASLPVAPSGAAAPSGSSAPSGPSAPAGPVAAVAAKGPAEPLGPKQRWYKRLPSPRRFLLWNLFCWFFGASALVGGILYTEHVVKPIAEAGGTAYTPADLLKKENAGVRVFGNTDRMNILVLGIDYNHDNKGIIYTKGARSDTMMVLSLSRDAKFANVVSVPRDTQVFIGEGYGYDKINSAYSYGGVEQAKKVVSNFLGIPIHHHLVVKVTGAKSLIDVLGGLPIDVEKDLDYDDNWGHLHIHLKKGPQVLNGEEAVGYARFRMDEEGDRGRIRRQQQVIKALGGKLKEPALMAQFNNIAKAVKETLETDLKPLEMVDLANLYGSFDFKAMRSAAIVGDDAMDANGVSYILPYAPENERTVRRLLKSLDWTTKSDLRIRVYFKGASPDVAYRLADRLADSGFDGVQVEALPADDTRDTKATHIIWHNKVTRLEGILKSVVGSVPEQKAKQSTGRDDDLVIVVGDGETGAWAELPTHLKQPRPSQTYRDDSRYNGDFIPRQLPQSQQPIGQPYVADPNPEVDYTEQAEDVTEQTYPTATTPDEEEAPVPEQAVPDYQEEPPTEIPTSPEPIPAAPPVESAPPIEPAPAPMPAPAPAPMPAATPIDGVLQP